MAEPSPPATSAPISDRRPVPSGVLPRHVQTWLMAALAVAILLIIFVTGGSDAPARRVTRTTPAAQEPSPDRVRDYQERLRAMEARAAQEPQAGAVAPPMQVADPNADLHRAPVDDPIASERRRREYESLFASNVVLSRRPSSQRPDAGSAATTTASGTTGSGAPPATPSIDDVADAVVRATTRATGSGSPSPLTATPQPATSTTSTDQHTARPRHTPAISAAGPMHRLLEGTTIDTVLANRLDGSVAAPVNCLVTNPIYSHHGQHVVIPAGARVLGETKPVQSFGESRLAVAFHRLVFPDGRTESLDQFLGLNQIGDAGLRDRVNNHYWSTFGAAAAVGLISGLAQAIGTAGFGGDGGRTVIIAGGTTDATSQASLQVMHRFLNRVPTITIREGHRVKVYLTSDLELPAYAASTLTGK